MNSIFRQIVSAQVVTVAVLMVALGVLLRDGVREGAEREFSVNCNTLADAIATSLEPAMVNRDAVTAQSALDAGLRKPNVEWAFAVDGAGHVVAHTFVPRFPDDLLKLIGRETTRLETVINFANQDLRVLRVPVLAGIAGHLVLGVEQDILAQAQARMTSRLVWTLCALLTAFTCLFALLARRITRPLTLLSQDIQRLREDPKAEMAQAPDGSTDEIGQLRTAFQQLASEVTAQQIRLEQGIQLRTAQLNTALSQATSASTRLAASEGRIRAILDSCMDAVVTFTPEGIVTSWNLTALDMFQFTPEEVKGQPLGDLILKDAADPSRDRQGSKLLSHLADCRGGKHARSITLEARRKDGSVLSVELVITPFVDEHGLSLCAFIRDVTDRLAAEQELIHARDAAEAGSRSKSEFLATMSHEIRTPMNGVLGFVNLLEDTPLNTDQKELIRTVRSSAEALLTIINDVLDFSKIEAGALELEAIPMEIVRLGSDVVDLMVSHAEARGLQLIFAPSHSLPSEVVGDPGRIRQVILNLVGNAVKFTESGHVLLSMKWSDDPSMEDRGWMEVSVQDTGVGIPADRLSRLFQRFSQADASTTRRFGGTGLGLAITKRLVEKMGGEVHVVSSPDKGSIFSFRIPMPRLSKSSAPSEAPPPLAGRRVLIQDPLEAGREALRAWVEAQGLTCTTVATAGEALATLLESNERTQAFSIAILDQSLNEGHSCLNPVWLKRNPSTQRMLLTALIPSSQRSESRRLIEGGYDLVLTRPIARPHALSQWADQCLSLLEETSYSLRRFTSFNPAQKPGPLRTTALPREDAAGLLAEESPGLRGAKILVADDNPTNRKLVARMLEKMGVSVTLAENGNEALEKVSSQPFDLVFMDCQMPELDGYAATGEIRIREKGGAVLGSQRQPGSPLPVVALTANALEGDRDRCLAAGMSDYLTKPIQSAALKAILRKWITAPVRP